jgi:hypothetical protein
LKRNNSEKNIINCAIRPFDCSYSNPIFTDDLLISKHLCNLIETDCDHAYIDIKDERKAKLNKINDIDRKL